MSAHTGPISKGSFCGSHALSGKFSYRRSWNSRLREACCPVCLQQGVLKSKFKRTNIMNKCKCSNIGTKLRNFAPLRVGSGWRQIESQPKEKRKTLPKDSSFYRENIKMHVKLRCLRLSHKEPMKASITFWTHI